MARSTKKPLANGAVPEGTAVQKAVPAATAAKKATAKKATAKKNPAPS
jgi:hypothetical protein